MSQRLSKKFIPLDYRHEISSRLKYLGENGKETYYVCPFCGSKEKSKFSVNHRKGDTGVFHCYSCEKVGNGYQLLQTLAPEILKTKTDSLEKLTNKIIQDSRTKTETETPPPEKKKYRYSGLLKNTYTDETTGKEILEKQKPTHSFSYRDETGKELYRRLVAPSGEWSKKKNKHKKIVRPVYTENGIEYFGLPPGVGSIFYGLESLKENGVCFIFEGEKKRDSFETALRLRQYLDETILNTFKTFCSLSSGGASQLPDKKTIEALRKKNIQRVVLIPDIDPEGRNFVIKSREILSRYGIKTYILDLEFYLPPSIKVFSGYDIEDGLKDKLDLLDIILNVSQEEETLKLLQTFYFAESSEKEKVSFYSRYITEGISSEWFQRQFTKTFIVKSLQGTGKTEFLHSLKKNGHRLLYITPREALCRDVSERLEIQNYQDFKIGDEKEYGQELVVCLNSIHKFSRIISDSSEFTVCIDEIDHTLKDLFTSPLLKDSSNKEFRSKVFQIIVSLLKNSKYVFFTSADIPDYVFKFLEMHSIEYYFLENTFKDWRNYINVNSPKESSIFREILKTLQEKKKTSVSINCKKTAKKLIRYLRRHSPQSIVLFLEQKKTKQEADILKNRDFDEYDVVIYTPTIFTGVDFSIDFGENHFCIIPNNRTVNHFEILQSCFRFRRAKNIYFWIKDIRGSKETDPEKITEKGLRRREEFSRYGSLTSETDLSMLSLFSVIESENNKSRNNLKGMFIETILLRIEDSSQYRILGEDLSEEDQEKEKAELKEIQEELKNEEIENILQAPILEEKRLIELENGSYHKSEEEKYSEIKTQFVKFTNLDPDSPEFRDIVSMEFSSLRSAVYQTKNLIFPIEDLIKEDSEKTSSYVGDDEFFSLRTIGIKEVLQTLSPGIDFTSKEALLRSPLIIDEKGLQTLQERLQDSQSRERLSTLLKIKESEKASYVMRACLDFLGWKREGVQVRSEGGRVRRYKINKTHIEKLFSMGEKRESVTDQ